MKKVVTVVLNYCNLSDTIACVESLLRCAPAPEWIIVVDNASPDDSYAGLKSWISGNWNSQCETKFSKIGQARSALSSRVIELTEDCLDIARLPDNTTSNRLYLVKAASNRGYAAGNNLGIRLGQRLGAEAFLLCNNDTLFTPDAILHLEERLFATEKPGLCGPTLCYFYHPEIVQCRAGGYTNRWTGLSRLNGQGLFVEEALALSPAKVESQLNFIYGACVMASQTFVETVGLMHEGYFLYCEEQDWAWSAKGRFSLSYAPKARVYHKEGGTTGFSARTFTLKSMGRIGRSRLRLHFRHAPWTLPMVALCLTASLLRKFWRCLSQPSPPLRHS